MLFIKAIVKFLWRISVLTNCLIEKIKIPDTYYINNDYTNVTKVYEEFFEIRTGSKHKKRRKTKKLVSQKNR